MYRRTRYAPREQRLPSPEDGRARRIATLVDFAGPVAATAIADALDIRIDNVRELLHDLATAGYVEVQPADRYAAERVYIPTGRWCPDDDQRATHRNSPRLPED